MYRRIQAMAYARQLIFGRRQNEKVRRKPLVFQNRELKFMAHTYATVQCVVLMLSVVLCRGGRRGVQQGIHSAASHCPTAQDS